MTTDEIMAYSQEELFDKNNLLTVFEEESEMDRFFLLEAFIDKSNEYKCKSKMKSLISAVKKDVDRKIKEQKRAANNKTEFGRPEGELFCGNWIADMTGIRILTIFGDKLACYHPIMPVERLFNIETKTEKITLAYYRDGVWKEITVDKAIIASASKIVKLADYGIAVTSETAKTLVQYLSDIENLNIIPVKNSTSKFGWHGEEFIPFDKSVVFDDESRFRELSKSLIPRGSFETWLDLVREVRKNTAHYEPQVYMSACFASILVSKLNMLPFIVNLWGSTGKGKTVALMIACSIFADPSEGKYITDSYATQNAFEIRLDILNHLPLLMDDMSKVRDKMNNDFTDLIYLLCSGKGKDRSNIDLGLNKMKCWQNTILSNMERPLAAETMKGGAINRILDFEMADGYIFQDGNRVVEILKDNYGWAGVKYVDFIKELPVEAINAIRKDFEAKIKEEAKRQDSEKEEKQILPMSLLLTADKIATDYIFEDGIYLDIPTMVSQLKDIDEVSEGQRAYDAIIQAVQRNPNRFDCTVLGEQWGYIERYRVNILPTVVKDIARTENFSVKAFCSWAKRKNLICTNNSKNQNVMRWNGKSTRFYTIMLPEDEEEEAKNEFHDTAPDEQNELPFD